MFATIGKVLLGLWMIAIIVATFKWLHSASNFQVPELARILVFHVPNPMVATVASIVSAIFALLFLVKRRPIDDIRSHAAALLAIIFWLTTTITGAVFASVEWGVPWNWDPKQSCILVLLLVYVSYFALRTAFTDEHKQAVVAAAWTIFACCLVPFLTLVIPNSTPSLHPQGVITTKEGMSADYKIVFWSATFCTMGLAYWMYCMLVQVDLLAMGYRRRALVARES